MEARKRDTLLTFPPLAFRAFPSRRLDAPANFSDASRYAVADDLERIDVGFVDEVGEFARAFDSRFERLAHKFGLFGGHFLGVAGRFEIPRLMKRMGHKSRGTARMRRQAPVCPWPARSAHAGTAVCESARAELRSPSGRVRRQNASAIGTGSGLTPAHHETSLP